MNVLIGCEESGAVRDAFRKRGHNAYSNDIQETSQPGPHLLMCVMDALDWLDWDVIILHPECKTVCVAGNRHYAGTPARAAQVDWIEQLWRAAKLKARKGVALENPASVIWPRLRPQADQVQFIQPWQHGHLEQKKTGLALDRLPPLKETNNVYAQMMRLPQSQREKVFFMTPSAERSKLRSKTYSGIADAMAEQWGDL
jgi:hypothetical protein